MGITKEAFMKKLLITALCCAAVLALAPAQAGEGHGGWRSSVSAPRVMAHGWGGGPGGRGAYSHHGGYRSGWVGPVVAAAVLGSVLYATHAPVYATPAYPPVVVAPQPAVAYYCATYQQYYPAVPTCPVPWQAVPY